MPYRVSLLPFIKRYILWSKIDCNLGFPSTRFVHNIYNEHCFDEFDMYKLQRWQFYSYFLYEFLGNLHRISFQVKQFMNERLNAGASNKHQIQIWKKSGECIVMLRNVTRFLTVYFNNINTCVAQCQIRENKFWYTSNSK